MPSRGELLRQARTALSASNYLEAGRRCATLLSDDPQDIEAIYLNGRCHAALGKWAEAAAEFRRVLTLRPGFLPGMIDLGLALALAGNHRDAYPLLQRARTLQARSEQLHFGLGLCLMQAGDLPRAATEYLASLACNPRFPDAYNNLGVVHDRLGQLPQAVECFRQAVAIRPGFATAHINLGNALLRLGQAAAAAAAFQEAALLRPQDAILHADLGTARLAAHDFDAAVAALERALSLDRNLAHAACNLGEALLNLNFTDRAAAAFNRAVEINGNLAEAHLGLGRIAAALGNTPEAETRLLRASQLKPGDPTIALVAAKALEALGCQHHALELLSDGARSFPGNVDIADARGQLLHRLGHLEAAVLSFEAALIAQPDRADTLTNLGRVLESLGRQAEAMVALERAQTLRPGHAETIAALASCAFRICAWDAVDQAMTGLRDLPLGLDALHPFLLLAAGVAPAEQLLSLRRRGPPRQALREEHVSEYRSGDRLRVAYLSPDFRDHPVAHAIAGVIDRHDRHTITPIGISLAASDTSEIGSRLRSSFNEFIEASGMSDLDVATLMKHRGIDVAIDLAGHTRGGRPGIFARRAAPVQVNFLGFPATTGFDCMDYIIADDIVLPPHEEEFYTERVLRMPNCYLPFDCSRPHPLEQMGREEAGLPPDAFVFCAFNAAYKITRETFDLWISILRDVPGSVLWLRHLGELASARLRAAAAARDIAPDRLIFAPHLASVHAHIARLRLAGIFLDSSPYNAHTSAAEALWAGVPVLTRLGSTFAGRVGASLLTAAKVPELICADSAGYRSLAVKLANSPAVLQSLRDRLIGSRSTATVFDTERYTRAFESLLISVHASR